MNKCLLVITLVCFTTIANGQSNKAKPSLSETIDWIVGKLNANSGLFVVCNSKTGKLAYRQSDYNIVFNESDMSFIIHYKTTWPGSSPESEYDVLPLRYITKVEYKVEPICGAGTANNSMLLLYTNGKKVKSDAGIESNYALIPFTVTSEDNLENRMKQAFTNLRSHFPQTKEAF